MTGEEDGKQQCNSGGEVKALFPEAGGHHCGHFHANLVTSVTEKFIKIFMNEYIDLKQFLPRGVVVSLFCLICFLVIFTCDAFVDDISYSCSFFSLLSQSFPSLTSSLILTLSKLQCS